MENSFRNGALLPVVRNFFNDDAATSRLFLKSHIESWPDDALAWALTAAIEFYDRAIRWALAGGASPAGPLMGGWRLDLDPECRQTIVGSLRRAEELAQARLANDDLADMATFALCVVESIRRDFAGLVLNQWTASLGHAREANLLGRRLLKVSPEAHDAYCIFGLNEYLISRVPAIARRFATVPGIKGDRKKAIQFHQVAARTGRYYRDLARCMLVVLYWEEGEFETADRTLAGLAEEFPRNMVVAAALGRQS